MEILYNVVLKGLRASADPQEARTHLAALFKAAPDKIASLLAQGHHVVKRGVSLAIAEQYRTAIDRAGGVCEFETVPGPLPAPASASAPAGSPAAAQAAKPVAPAAAPLGKKCAKCGYHRKPEESAPDWQCPQCGIAYAKAAEAAGSEGRSDSRRARSAEDSLPVEEQNARRMGMFAHLSVFVGLIVPVLGSIVPPIVIWQLKKNDDNELAAACSKEALNFQISWVILMVLSILGVFITTLFSVFVAILMLSWFVLPIIAAVKASGGESYEFPFIWHPLK